MMAPSPPNIKKNKAIAWATILVTIAFPLIGYFGSFHKYIPATRADIQMLELADKILKEDLERHTIKSQIELLHNDISDLKRERERLELLKIQNEKYRHEVEMNSGDVDIYIRERVKLLTRLKDIESDIDSKTKLKQTLKDQL